jgi:hypothetical protein
VKKDPVVPVPIFGECSLFPDSPVETSHRDARRGARAGYGVQNVLCSARSTRAGSSRKSTCRCYRTRRDGESGERGERNSEQGGQPEGDCKHPTKGYRAPLRIHRACPSSACWQTNKPRGANVTTRVHGRAEERWGHRGAFSDRRSGHEVDVEIEDSGVAPLGAMTEIGSPQSENVTTLVPE